MKIRNRTPKGITLVEMILYVALFSIFMSFSLGFFWQMQKARVRSDQWIQLKENAAQSMQFLKTQIRNSDGLDAVSSQLNAEFSSISINTPAGPALFDTGLKTIEIGGIPVEIRTLRFSLPNLPPEDLTSNHVTVTRFQADDVAGGGAPSSLRIRLSLSSVNPGSDPLYDSVLESDTTISFRAENP